MDTDNKKLAKDLDENHTKLNEPLSKHTTLKIGGPADILFEAHSIEELIYAAGKAKKLKVPVTIIGWGSNILVSDNGIRGLVIKNMSRNIKIKGEKPAQSKSQNESQKITARWESDRKKGSFKYEFKDLDYDETDKPRIEAILDSGVSLPYAINYLIDKGITGLQWFAGIPGTIGGAVFNNIHGGSHFLSEYLIKVKVLDKDLKVKELDMEDLGFDYDKSRFHDSEEIILQATFSLFKGDAQRAKATTLEWAKRKSIQPKNSPGCTFANISQEEKERLNYPTTSVGYIVEHVLKMSGFQIGNAAISKQHHNFIVNKGKATAKDYLAVMKEIYKRTKKQIGIRLVSEIFLIGFDKEEIKEFS